MRKKKPLQKAIIKRDLLIFDTKTPVGAGSEPQNHRVGDKTVTSFIIRIGRSDEELKLYLKE